MKARYTTLEMPLFMSLTLGLFEKNIHTYTRNNRFYTGIQKFKFANSPVRNSQIRASLTQRDAYISLSFRRTWDMLFIICENTYNPNTVQRKEGLLISSKRAGSYGLGIRSIKETVERNGGTYYFDAGKDVFRITTILPYGVQEGIHDR